MSTARPQPAHPSTRPLDRPHPVVLLRRLCCTVLWVICLVILLTLSHTQVTAQAPHTYTVQPGDTLAQIASRFGVSLEALATANGITNVDLISVGQVLVIPGAEQTLPFAISHPGETLENVAERWGVAADQLAALNEMDTSTRLFPGQPIYLPPTATETRALRFGAVTALRYPRQIVQGKTGWLVIESSRPVSLTAAWNNLPLVLTDHPRGSGDVRYTAHVPVPALLGPGQFPLVLRYTARSGTVVTRSLSIDVLQGNYISQQILLSPERSALLAPEIAQAELVTVTAAWSKTDTPIYWQAPFQRPIADAYATTSPYGTRRSYDGGPYNTYHAGQDFGAPAGVTVTVPADAIVALAQPLNVRGNAVILDHGGGVFTGYWHLSEFFVEPGQQVAAGDQLGLVGNTGLSTGAHLHWELRIYGIAVDPMQYLTEPLFPDIE